MWGVLVDLNCRGIERPDGKSNRLRVKDGVHLFPSKASAKKWMLDMMEQAGYARTENSLEEFQYSLDTLDFFHLKPIVLSEAYKKATGEG